VKKKKVIERAIKKRKERRRERKKKKKRRKKKKSNLYLFVKDLQVPVLPDMLHLSKGIKKKVKILTKR